VRKISYVIHVCSFQRNLQKKQLGFIRIWTNIERKVREKAKNISMSVAFELPQAFRFRKGFEGVETLLQRSFILRKSWSREASGPKYFLNDDRDKLSFEDRATSERYGSGIKTQLTPLGGLNI